MEEHNFFNTYHIDPLKFDRSGLKWETLKEIADNYGTIKNELDFSGKQVLEQILHTAHVHSINYRIKKDEHLIEKIIRKTIQNPLRKIDPDNYKSEITDLIGIRAIHLFKEDWIHIHNFIKDTWQFEEQPIAYVRNGDSKRILDYYKENNCQVEEHPYGYRSVHYVLKTTYNNKEYFVEIQVRTIFEEAWGEIDHAIRYPYHADKELLFRLSSILNRIAGSADELGTYIRYLKSQTERTEIVYNKEINNKNAIIDDLKKQIDALGIANDDKSRITETLVQLEKETTQKQDSTDDLLWLDTLIQTPLFKNITSRIEEITSSDQFKPIDINDSDLEIMKKAQSELFKMLQKPEKLRELLTDEHVSKLIAQLGEDKLE
ncbi:MAG: RelA/SpoT domain-containing protein [Spirochaetia bacterium]|nr:RelA/SpoT domain-containing protein [Spirochaetia bacterium]